jgi:hypothetical protein
MKVDGLIVLIWVVTGLLTGLLWSALKAGGASWTMTQYLIAAVTGGVTGGLVALRRWRGPVASTVVGQAAVAFLGAMAVLVLGRLVG